MEPYRIFIVLCTLVLDKIGWRIRRGLIRYIKYVYSLKVKYICWKQIQFLFSGMYCLVFCKSCLIGTLNVFTVETIHNVDECLPVEIMKHLRTASSACYHKALNSYMLVIFCSGLFKSIPSFFLLLGCCLLVLLLNILVMRLVYIIKLIAVSCRECLKSFVWQQKNMMPSWLRVLVHVLFLVLVVNARCALRHILWVMECLCGECMWNIYSFEQRVFLCTFIRYALWKESAKSFVKTFWVNSAVQKIIYRIVGKLNVLYVTKIWRKLQHLNTFQYKMFYIISSYDNFYTGLIMLQ